MMDDCKYKALNQHLKTNKMENRSTKKRMHAQLHMDFEATTGIKQMAMND